MILSAYGTYAQSSYYNGRLIPLNPDSIQPGYYKIDTFDSWVIHWYKIQEDTFGIWWSCNYQYEKPLATSLLKYRPPIIRKNLWRSNWEYFGKRSWFYKNGNKRSEHFVDHEKWNGEFNLYYRNGKIKQHGAFRNNKKSGEWTSYDKYGKVLKRKNFG